MHRKRSAQFLVIATQARIASRSYTAAAFCGDAVRFTFDRDVRGRLRAGSGPMDESRAPPNLRFARFFECKQGGREAALR
jgi:hypothetical protein